MPYREKEWFSLDAERNISHMISIVGITIFMFFAALSYQEVPDINGTVLFSPFFIITQVSYDYIFNSVCFGMCAFLTFLFYRSNKPANSVGWLNLTRTLLILELLFVFRLLLLLFYDVYFKWTGVNFGLLNLSLIVNIVSIIFLFLMVGIIWRGVIRRKLRGKINL